jgi:hypothetical protein
MQGRIEDKEIFCFQLNFPGNFPGKFRRHYAWVMREIRDLHSLSEQWKSRWSWYYLFYNIYQTKPHHTLLITTRPAKEILWLWLPTDPFPDSSIGFALPVFELLKGGKIRFRSADPILFFAHFECAVAPIIACFLTKGLWGFGSGNVSCFFDTLNYIHQAVPWDRSKIKNY